jgi:putative transposase
MSLAEFVVMPNHIHGIIVIHDGVQNFEPQPDNPPISGIAPARRINQYQHIIPASIGSMVRAYKAAVTLWNRRNGWGDFKWQRNFYEHIIRNEEELRRIQEYIVNNPLEWEKDKLNPAGRKIQGKKK